MKKSSVSILTLGLVLIFALVYSSSCSNNNKARNQANEFYKQGQELWKKGGVQNLLQAAEFFQKSVDADSTFADGYASLSLAYTTLGVFYCYLSPEKVWPIAIPAANKAVVLNKDLALAYRAKAYSDSYPTWSWGEIEKNLKHALELEPENVGLILEYAGFLYVMNKTGESQALLDRARKISKDSLDVENYLKRLMLYTGEFDKVKPLLQKDIDTDPKNPYAYWVMATLCSKQGSHQEAINMLNIQIPMMEGDVNDETALLGYNYARLGKTEDAMAQIINLDKLSAKGNYVSPIHKAWIYAGLNNTDETIAWLEKGYSEHAFRMGLDMLTFSYIFKNVEQDPRYHAILKKMNL